MNVRRTARWVEEAAPLLGTPVTHANFLGTAVSPRRVWFFGIVGAIFLGLLFVRVIQLQLVQGNEWRLIAERNRLRTQQLLPDRGILFDRSMVPLVTNVPMFRLVVRAEDLPREPMARTQALQTLARLVDLDAERTEQVVRAIEHYRYSSAVLRDGISYDEAVSIYLRSAEYPSLTIERGARRMYVEGVPGMQKPTTPSFSHLLGYVGRISPDELSEQRLRGYIPTDVIGKTGVEFLFESYVRGTPGSRNAEVDSRGNERGTVAVSPPQIGEHVVLSIDAGAQQELERALRAGLARAGRQRGAAVALDPRTGEILALVSTPTFDNNDFAHGISSDAYAQLTSNQNQPLLNRAISGQFPSGSTLKPFVAAAALQEKIITPDTVVYSTGGLQVGKWFFPDWKEGGHGATDIYKAIAWSVNSYFYTIGGGYGTREGLGPQRLKRYLEYFGFGRYPGSGLPGEQRGIVPSPERKQELIGEPWYVGDTYNMSIGQGDVLVTPLQMAVATAAIANGGTVWKPHLMRGRIAADGAYTAVLPQEAAKVPVDAEWLRVVRAAMRTTVTNGSAPSLRRLPFSVAGKTGTAQWSKNKNPHAWFISFAPYEAPEIVVVMILEEGGEGGIVTVPAVREFYEWWGRERLGALAPQ